MAKFFRLNSRPNKGKNRDKLEIVRDLLSAALQREKKTRIMYQANLSYQLMEKYLTNLLGTGLVACRDDAFYLVTKKGKEFLQMYEDYLNRCLRIEETIQGASKEKLFLENMCTNNNESEEHEVARGVM